MERPSGFSEELWEAGVRERERSRAAQGLPLMLTDPEKLEATRRIFESQALEDARKRRGGRVS